ncbi:MAG: DUF3347 domain-containing protein [Flavobacteriales bacterium]|nr:DUF3347 domain-containing protein [Flavobacteriales bacterium]
MRTFILLLSTLATALLTSCTAQLHHARTVSVHITGNCGLCETTIEKAAFVKGEASADWNKDTKQAVLTFDSTRTNADAVLKRIALAGYDNERYLAPDAAYAALPGCCQYERTLKMAPVAGAEVHGQALNHPEAEPTRAQTTAEPLFPVFNAYFKLKDALVAGDAPLAMKAASGLDGALHNVDQASLSSTTKAAFTEAMANLMPVLHPFTTTKDLEKQRALFAQLTLHMARLAKAAPASVPIYVAHCPMYQGGADWMSLEKDIKNPFYGRMMLTCGSVKETIAK